VSEFSDPVVAIIKHANPCGVGSADSTIDAYKKALLCDPVSAFGGIIALNRPLNRETSEEIIKVFSEVIIAPSVEADALEVLKAKEKLRVLTTGGMPDPTAHRRMVKTLSGGLLVQDRDDQPDPTDEWKVVTDRKPTEAERNDLGFGWKVCKHVKSNAILLAQGGAVVGVGAGQMSRLDSSFIAAHKAGERSQGAALASDAFFPFRDGVDEAAKAGVTAIIQPGGSVQDDQVIAACNEHDIAMIFTGRRHFKH